MTDRDLMQQALDALEMFCEHGAILRPIETRDAIKEALAQPEQEPVAWMTPDGEGFRIRFSPPVNDVPLGWDALYAAPPQRTWVELTIEEIAGCCMESTTTQLSFAKNLEAKLKERNT